LSVITEPPIFRTVASIPFISFNPQSVYEVLAD
jgi:hypothetical protein